MHPREHRLTRRNLVRGAIGASAAVGVAGVAAGCQNTTTAVGADEGGAASLAVRKLVVPRPTGPNGLPLPRPDYSVTWRVTGDNPPIKEGLQPEGGTLNVYNYADYIWPGLVKRFEKQYKCQVKIATYNSADEATAKLSAGSVDFDVVIGLSANNMVTLIAQQLMLPLTHSYLPNLAKNIWPALQDPFYDREARFTVPYVVWLDGIGWRNDKISNDIAGMKVPWDIFWESKPWTGKVGILDDQRDALAMPMQRDAMRVGRIPDLNTEDPEIIAKAGRDLSELTSISNVKVDITDYQTLPEGKSWLHQAWSGDMLAAVLYLPAQGHQARRDLVLGARSGRRRAERPALGGLQVPEARARARIPELHARHEERIRQLRAVQRLHATAEFDRRGISGQEGPDSEERLGRRSAADQFANNQELLALSVEGAKLWQNAWAKFKAG